MAGAWSRERLIVAPPQKHAWWASHAQAPTILPLPDGLWRVYFGARDSQPVSRILCVDLDPADDMRIVTLREQPVLEHGPAGSFDCHGVVPGCAMIIGGRIHLYYTGIVRRKDVPYATMIGVAVSDDGLNFERSAGPAMPVGPRDPFFTSAPYVGRCGEAYEMWYVSGLGWSYRPGDAREEPIYNIRRTTSSDGLLWSAATEVMLGDSGVPESVVARPWLLQSERGLRLWYSRRSTHEFRTGGSGAYRIWATAGGDGPQSARIEPGIPIEYCPLADANDWDNEMQAYPCVAPVGDDLIMLYNGNGFGRTGFGFARLAGGARQCS